MNVRNWESGCRPKQGMTLARNLENCIKDDPISHKSGRFYHSNFYKFHESSVRHRKAFETNMLVF